MNPLVGERGKRCAKGRIGTGVERPERRGQELIGSNVKFVMLLLYVL